MPGAMSIELYLIKQNAVISIKFKRAFVRRVGHNSKSTLRYLRRTKLLLTKAPNKKTCIRNNDLDLQTNMARGTCLRSYNNLKNFCQNRLKAFRGVFRILKRLVKNM